MNLHFYDVKRNGKRAVSGVKISEVNHSNGADSRPTTFFFDSPVYVQNGVEVAIVLQTDSDKYLTWISRMGERDVGGGRMISEQPYLGVLFKSQNNSTWSAYDFEDLKFTLYRASFDTNVNGKLTLTNDALDVAKTLEKTHYNSLHPLQMLRLHIVTIICMTRIVM